MSSDCLRVGHLNVYHIQIFFNDLNVFFESHQPFHLFGFSETRLKSHIPSECLSLPHYPLIRKDAARSQHTGLVVYMHSLISKIVRRRPDLESEALPYIAETLTYMYNLCIQRKKFFQPHSRELK